MAKEKRPLIEVCYVKANGHSTRAVCEELDRSAVNGGTSLADAMAGNISTLGRKGGEVSFPPDRLVWARVLNVVAGKRKRRKVTINGN